MQFLEETMNERTKAVILDRVFRLNRDISWNTNSIFNAETALEEQRKVIAAQEAERAALIEDLKAAGVEVDVPVQN
jgi:hypothetical protein